MIIYRTPSQSDIAALAELTSSTFVDTFGHLYSAENLQKFVDDTYSAPVIARELADVNRLYQVADDQGRMVGYCKLGFDHSFDFDLSGHTVIELKQLYLRPSHFGLGIADELMNWAIAQARSRQADDILLSVYSDNPRAQKFYKRYGFVHAADTFFMVGEHRDEEYLYRLVLR
jgi:diamine N-acetyltransferase